jgi:hypothetical protein
MDFAGGSHGGEVGDRIEDDDVGREILHHLMDADQVHFQAVDGGPGGMVFQKPLPGPLLHVETEGLHVPLDLGGGFLESEVQAPFAPAAGGIGEEAGDAGFAAPRRARNQDGGAPVEALALQHGIELRDAGAYPLPARLMIQA